jgi:hypothetical protein
VGECERTRHRRGLDRIHGSSLANLLRLPAFLHIWSSPSHHAIEFFDEGAACLAAVFPWAKPVLATSNYLRLDATFKAAHPLALAVPLAIEANEAFPPGFIIGSSEKTELYECFATFIKGLGCENYGRLPVLSDAGTGLQRSVRDCDERGPPRYPAHFLYSRKIRGNAAQGL